MAFVLLAGMLVSCRRHCVGGYVMYPGPDLLAGAMSDR